MNLPTLVYHADWSSRAAHRWCAKATLGADGRYTASASTLVGGLKDLFRNLKAEAGDAGCVFAGFDFPIGFPEHYATRANISRFREFLKQVGNGNWAHFYSVCEHSDQISIHRPFYPVRYENGCSQQQLLDGLNAQSVEMLLRRCELGGGGQRQACALFWTIGGNQVGKAAIVGWRDVLVPAIEERLIQLWPFEGNLETLLQPGSMVVAETYPAECYSWFPGNSLTAKTQVNSRAGFGVNLLAWAENSGVTVEPQLQSAIEKGFDTEGEDAFDAVVGLFGMLQIVIGQRTTGEPKSGMVSDIEGWILGRQGSGAALREPQFSATNDPELRDWLHWATESCEASNFIRAIAEAALIADSNDYAMMRPMLQKLKRQHTR